MLGLEKLFENRGLEDHKEQRYLVHILVYVKTSPI